MAKSGPAVETHEEDGVIHTTIRPGADGAYPPPLSPVERGKRMAHDAEERVRLARSAKATDKVRRNLLSDKGIPTSEQAREILKKIVRFLKYPISK